MNGGENKGYARRAFAGKSGGYTIIEVLLFVAISGFMFVVAAIFINGKQAQVAFKQGMNGANSEIDSIVNQVANGEYNSLGNYKCSAGAGSGPQFTNGSQDQGANEGCIFVGKVLQFNPAGNPSSYEIYTVAGRQFDATTGEAVTSFSAALPCVVDSCGGSGPNLTTSGQLQDGLQITHMLQCAGNDPDCTNGASVGAFGFFSSFSSLNSQKTGDLQSGSQSIVTAVVPHVNYGDTVPNAIAEMNQYLGTIGGGNVIGSGDYLLLCFEYGTKTGAVTIGGSNGQQFTTNVKIGGEPAACKS